MSLQFQESFIICPREDLALQKAFQNFAPIKLNIFHSLVLNTFQTWSECADLFSWSESSWCLQLSQSYSCHLFYSRKNFKSEDSSTCTTFLFESDFLTVPIRTDLISRVFEGEQHHIIWRYQKHISLNKIVWLILSACVSETNYVICIRLEGVNYFRRNCPVLLPMSVLEYDVLCLPSAIV